MNKIFEINSAIQFKDYLNITNHEEQLKKKINTSNCLRICKYVDVDLLTLHERKLLFENGNYTPELYYYWSKLIFEINKIVFQNELNAFWIHTGSKKYFDATVDVTLSLMTDSIAWENNNSELLFVWGNITPKDLFRSLTNCDGIILPFAEGWGILGYLNDRDHTLLHNFF